MATGVNLSQILLTPFYCLTPITLP